ncbi:MAG: polyprenyl synthetase family protein, partial [Treponemataceae bacterium]
MNNDYTQELENIEAILNKNLSKSFLLHEEQSIFGNLYEGVSPANLSSLVNPCKDLLSLGGKRWRPLFLVLVAQMVDENSGIKANGKIDPYELTSIVEFIHTASLIHDDIEDNADTRRGQPATHITHGVDTAINAATWLYFHALSSINTLEISCDAKEKIYLLATTEIRRLHLGQAMDISWHRDSKFIPSKKEYEAMVCLKTGTLACLSAKLGALSSCADSCEIDKLGVIAADIGFGFQVLDDVLNLTTGNIGKKRGDDIVEGKKSLPVILHIEKNPTDAEKIAQYFLTAQHEGIESPAVESCIKILETSNAIEEAKNRAKDLICQATSTLVAHYPKGKSSQKIKD